MADRENIPMLPPEGEEIPLGLRLRARRFHLGISRADMAERVGGYSPSHISQIEVSGINPSAELLAALCRELEITLGELIETPRKEVARWLDAGRVRKGRRRPPSPSIESDQHRDSENRLEKLTNLGTSPEETDSTPVARPSVVYDSPLPVSPHRVLIHFLTSTEEHLAAALQSLRGAREALEELMDEDGA